MAQACLFNDGVHVFHRLLHCRGDLSARPWHYHLLEPRLERYLRIAVAFGGEGTDARVMLSMCDDDCFDHDCYFLFLFFLLVFMFMFASVFMFMFIMLLLLLLVVVVVLLLLLLLLLRPSPSSLSRGGGFGLGGGRGAAGDGGVVAVGFATAEACSAPAVDDVA